jgi:hypothetical protein
LTSFDLISKSTALQKFSFSKDTRFKETKITHHRIGYDVPGAFNPKSRSTGFGFGDRVTTGRKGGNFNFHAIYQYYYV